MCEKDFISRVFTHSLDTLQFAHTHTHILRKMLVASFIALLEIVGGIAFGTNGSYIVTSGGL